jgi:hypothetical protein
MSIVFMDIWISLGEAFTDWEVDSLVKNDFLLCVKGSTLELESTMWSQIRTRG